jgi:hypothetical protein
MIDAQFIAPFSVQAQAQPSEPPDGILRSAIHAAFASLQDTLHAQVSAELRAISVLAAEQADDMPVAALRLALTAGGNGALVASLDRDAAAGLAGGAASTSLPMSAAIGIVVLSAAEAALRDLLSALARGLPRIASEPHRIVRLPNEPLPAHAPHHCADVGLTAGGRTGAMRFLVPSWMLSIESNAGQSGDAPRPA